MTEQSSDSFLNQIPGLPRESLPPNTNIVRETITGADFREARETWLGDEQLRRWPRGFYSEKFDYLPFSRFGTFGYTLGFIFLVIPILGAAIQTPSVVFDDIAITSLLFGIATVISWKFVIRALTVWSTVLFYVEFEDGSPTVYFGRRRTIIGRIWTRLWSRR